MTSRAPSRASHPSSAAFLGVFAATLGGAVWLLVASSARLPALLLLLVSALGLVAAWRLRTAERELGRLELRASGPETGALPRVETAGTRWETPATQAAEPAASVPADREVDPPPDLSDNGRPAQDLQILLAEDNPVNQEVALLMLTRLGYHADVASNGVEVLEALSRQHYDVILMDIRMPAMDGFEATREIRRQRRGRRRRPRIVALTAHADRQQCLAAGMDDYLTKPIHKEALASALWMAANPETRHTLGGPSETESIDRDRLALLRDLRNQAQSSLLAQIIDLFFQSSAEDLANLRAATERNDWPAVREAAHSLLGSSSDLGLTAVTDVCLELKELAPGCPPERLASTVERVEHHLRRARKALERVRALS